MSNLLDRELEFFEAIETSKIKRDDAIVWLSFLNKRTEEFIKKNHPFYFNEKYYPLKAQKINAGQKNPKFCICHHTSNKKRDYRPALHRFFQSKKASSHLLFTDTKEVLYLINVDNLAYHAFNKASLSTDVARLLKVENGWVNEVGSEIPGNGNFKLFNYEQFLSVICVHRYLFSYFPTMETIKSHKYFSPISRKDDPGVLFFLPLVEHAVKTDVNLMSKDYWLEEYKRDPVKFANNSFDIIKDYGLTEKDEWSSKRKNIKINQNYF